MKPNCTLDNKLYEITVDMSCWKTKFQGQKSHHTGAAYCRLDNRPFTGLYFDHLYITHYSFEIERNIHLGKKHIQPTSYNLLYSNYLTVFLKDGPSGWVDEKVHEMN